MPSTVSASPTEPTMKIRSTERLSSNGDHPTVIRDQRNPAMMQGPPRAADGENSYQPTRQRERVTKGFRPSVRPIAT